MSGWEAMQQGAPDPFFADQRGAQDCPNCDHGTDPKTLTTCNECEGTGQPDAGGATSGGQMSPQHLAPVQRPERRDA